MRIPRVLLTVCVSAAAVLTIPIASASAQATCAGADTPVTAANASAARAAMACLLNNERTTRGIPALNASAALDQADGVHADDMAARGFRDTDAPAPAPQGVTPRDRATTFGYAAGDVYGVWLASGPTPRDNALEIMSQGGLCSALIDPSYTDVGIGVASAADGPRFSLSLAGTGTHVAANPTCPVNKLVTPASPLVAAQNLAKQPAGVIAGQLGFPGTKACQSRRAFVIRIREPQNIKLRAASLYLAGKKSVAVRREGRLRGLVDLRGFTKGSFKLKIVATTTTGVKLTGYRTYKTCAGTTKL